VEVVNLYKYLGIALTTKLSTTQAVADFIPKAKRKIITILKALGRTINCTDWGVFSKTFDAQIQPALLYTSEIWGTGRVETVEKVHLFATKRLLRLSNITPSVIVYGESGIKVPASRQLPAIVQELCESRGGRPGLSVLTSLLVSVDVKIYCTVLWHWSQLVPNMSHDI